MFGLLRTTTGQGETSELRLFLWGTLPWRLGSRSVLPDAESMANTVLILASFGVGLPAVCLRLSEEPSWECQDKRGRPEGVCSC
jgi:hypothetical protein